MDNNGLNYTWSKTNYEFFSCNYDYSDNKGLTFWQWNPNANILIFADIDAILQKTNNNNYFEMDKLFGKAIISYKGIRVKPGHKYRKSSVEETRLIPPWCDLHVYIMGGDAKNILAVNREILLSELINGHSEVPKIINNTNETLSIGFANLILTIAKGLKKTDSGVGSNYIIDETGTNYKSLNMIDDHLNNQSDLCIILAIAAHCLYKRTIRATTWETVQYNNNPIPPEIEIDHGAAKYYQKAFRYFVGKLIQKKNMREIEVVAFVKNVRIIKPERSQLRASDFFEEIEDTWFTNESPRILLDDAVNIALIEPPTEGNEPIRIAEDIYMNIPFPLYWSALFYIQVDKEIVPIYKYCSVATKGFCLTESSQILLYNFSTEYAKLRLTDTIDASFYEREKYLLGERHVFPALEKYEILSVPFNKERCPMVLEHCGYVLITPITPALIRDNVLTNILTSSKEIVPGEKINYNELSHDNKRECVWDHLQPKNDINRDLYGMDELLLYIHNQHGKYARSINEYKQKYADFMIEYIERTVKYNST
ncbi:MAG: hypothetical protein FWD90_06530 [Defluviitaleaceae bacterium]|nr:hypothetical protein [Defluviitaleaceae bacterium]